MSNYTEADVSQDATRIEETLTLLPGAYWQHQSLGQQRLARLKAAALEGAKVPGLLSALASGLDYTPTLDKAPDIIRGMVAELNVAEQAEAELRTELSALQAQLMARTKAHNDLGASRIREVSALQARVAELEATESDLRRSCEIEVEVRTAVESERDALRAQVERMRDNVDLAVERIDAGTQPCRDVLRWLLSLPAPPAETTPAPERAADKS